MKKLKNVIPGEKVYCIEKEEKEVLICSYLFMAVCDNYVIVCCEDATLKNNFKAQLKEMSKDSAEYFGTEVSIFPDNEVFITKEEAIQCKEQRRNAVFNKYRSYGSGICG